MGAWGAGTLENDDALDLVQDALDSEEGAELVTEALRAAVDAAADGYVEAHDAAAALAAAELVAAARGAPAAGLSHDAGAWASRSPALASLDHLARAACRGVLASSELAELWEEQDALPAWRALVEDLARRLA